MPKFECDRETQKKVAIEAGIVTVTFLASFGIFYYIQKSFSPTGVTTEMNQEVCSLEDDSTMMTICCDAFEAGKALVEQAVYPTFAQLNPVCEPYYPSHNGTTNATDVCTTGLVNGAQAGVISLMWRGLMKTAHLQAAAAESALVTGGMFAMRHADRIKGWFCGSKRSTSAAAASYAKI